MKIILILFLLSFNMITNAQFGKRLLEQTKESAKRKATQKMEQKIDNAIDLGINKTDSVITGKKKKKKKGKEDNADDPTNENKVESNSAGDNPEVPSPAQQPATSTVTTPEAAIFTDNKLTLPALFYNDVTGSFDPDPNDELNAAGAAIKQQLKTKKILIKVFQKITGDKPSGAEEEYNAIRQYLVNRYGLDEERIFFYTPSAKKDGPLRLVTFVAVPETFKITDAAKY